MLAEKSYFTVSRMARLLEVSRPGFYAWCRRGPSARVVRAERIEAKVAWFHGASDEVSGSPKILVDLREDGETISRKTVAKPMRTSCARQSNISRSIGDVFQRSPATRLSSAVPCG